MYLATFALVSCYYIYEQVFITKTIAYFMISEVWTFGLQNLFVRTREPFFSNLRTFGLKNLRTHEPSNLRTFGLIGCNPNPTVAPCDLKLRFWLLIFCYNVAIFCKLVWYGMNRVNVFAIHRCINEGYGLIRIFTEKIRISPTKLWRVFNTLILTAAISLANF